MSGEHRPPDRVSAGGDAARGAAAQDDAPAARARSGRIARAFLNSKLTPLLVVFSLLLGVFAVLVTPREEEPQIKVPMIDVLVALPGATAQEVERRVDLAGGEGDLGDPQRRVRLLHDAALGRHDHRPLPGRHRPRSGGGAGARQAGRACPVAAARRPAAGRRAARHRRRPGRLPTRCGRKTPRRCSCARWRRSSRSELTRHPRVAQVWVLGGQRRVVRVDFDRERPGLPPRLAAAGVPGARRSQLAPAGRAASRPPTPRRRSRSDRSSAPPTRSAAR